MRPRALAGLMTAGGLIGLVASFVLAVEKIALLKDSGYQPSCSINPVLSCGSIMVTPQAEAFGFPNPLLGIAGFAALVVFGVLCLCHPAFPRSVWLAAQAMLTAAVVFVHWLIYQSLYQIGALCPYCMVVWVVTITVFWYVTLRNAAETTWGKKLATFHTAGLALWFITIVVLVTIRFWYFWSTMMS